MNSTLTERLYSTAVRVEDTKVNWCGPALKGQSAREDRKGIHHYANVKCCIGAYLYFLILFYSQSECVSHVVLMYFRKLKWVFSSLYLANDLSNLRTGFPTY